LNDELMDLDFDMSLFGLEKEINDIERIYAPEIIEDDVPEVDEENIITKLGDIWQLGRHRLMCGDSTDALNYKHLLQGVKVDLVFTDPPYGMKKEADGVLNDNLNYDNLLEFNKQWIPLTFDALKDNGSWYCWGIDEPLMDIYAFILKPMMRENKITFRNLITWNKFYKQKPTAIEMMRSYCVYDEKCLFVMCGVQGFSNNSDQYFEEYEPIRGYLEQEAKKAKINAKNIKGICGVGMYSHWFTKSQWDLMTEEHYKKIQNYCIENGINAFGVEFGEIKKQYDEIKKQWYETRAYFNNTHETYMTEVWDFETANEDEREITGGHATPKPIALCARAIKSSSRENEIVLDVFGGSGSTLIACEQLNRSCYMMELDPKYVQVIIQRYIAFKGTSDDVYRINADGTKTKYEDIKRWETLTGEKEEII
jgi:DNA modification methylase